MRGNLLAGLLAAWLVWLAPAGASAAGMVIWEDLGRYFAGYTGSFVLYDEDRDQYIIYNEAQSEKRLSPCSSFKIYNSLIGLETGVLNQEDALTREKWDGNSYSIPAWNKDQTLATATRDSVVWYFQRLASRIGPDRMQDYLDRLDYGNRDITGGTTTFWLQSSLQISAKEQVEMLRRISSGDSPFSSRNLEIVKRNITLEDADGVRLMGKTGSGYGNNKWLLGWFVGMVERDGKRYFFATNVENGPEANGGKARDITRALLKKLGIL